MEELDERFHGLLSEEQITLYGGFSWFNKQMKILEEKAKKWEKENADN